MADASYAFQISYSVTLGGLTIIHNQRVGAKLADAQLDPAPGTSLEDILLATRGINNVEGSVNARTGLSLYLASFVPLFGAQMNILSAALIYFPIGLTASFIYISAADLTDVNFYLPIGSNGGPCIETQQSIVTFFDSRGRVSKLVLMETVGDTISRLSAGQLGIAQVDFITQVNSTDSVIRGTESSSLTAMKIWNNTQNESTYRARYRG